MSAPFSDLQTKTEEALKAETEQVSLSNRGNAPVNIGLNTHAELACPIFICSAEQGEEDPPESGNYWMDCTVEVESLESEDTNLAAHRTRWKYVADQFAVDGGTLASNLTGRVTDFTCQAIKDRQLIPQRKEEGHVISGLRFRALCCPKDFPN